VREKQELAKVNKRQFNAPSMKIKPETRKTLEEQKAKGQNRTEQNPQNSFSAKSKVNYKWFIWLWSGEVTDVELITPSPVTHLWMWKWNWSWRGVAGNRQSHGRTHLSITFYAFTALLYSSAEL